MQAGRRGQPGGRGSLGPGGVPLTVEERKRHLDGRLQVFRCEGLALRPDRAVLRYRTDRATAVADVRLPVGTVTYAVYWVDRPYNVYHWLAPDGTSLGHYFNVAAETRIAPPVVEWLDLEVDVLVTPDGRRRVLDAELLPPSHRELVAAALAALADPQPVLREVEAITRPYREAT